MKRAGTNRFADLSDHADLSSSTDPARSCTKRKKKKKEQRVGENPTGEDPRKHTSIEKPVSPNPTDPEDSDEDEVSSKFYKNDSAGNQYDEIVSDESENLPSEGSSDYEITDRGSSDDSKTAFNVTNQKRKRGVKSNDLDKGTAMGNHASSKMSDKRDAVKFYFAGKDKPNPLIVIKELKAILKREHIEISSNRFSISVEIDDEIEREALCRIKTFDKCEVRVKTHIADLEAEERAVITGVPTSLGIESIVEFSKCKSAYRITRIEGGKKIPSMAVILTYERGEVPDEIKIAYLNLKPRPYIRAPVRCFRCNSYGHVVKHCLKTPKCSRCSGAHSIWECMVPGEQPSSCASCGSTSHITGDNKCPQKIRAKEISKLVTHGTSYAQAARALDRQVVDNSKEKEPRPHLMPLPGKREEETTSDKFEKLLDRLEKNIATKIRNTDEEMQNKLVECDNKFRHIVDQITEIRSKLDGLVNRLGDAETTVRSLTTNNRENMVNMEKNLTEYKNRQISLTARILDLFDLLHSMVKASAFSDYKDNQDIDQYNESSTKLGKVRILAYKELSSIRATKNPLPRPVDADSAQVTAQRGKTQ